MSRDLPHYDIGRESEFGIWLTNCRISTGDRQSDIALVLGEIDRKYGNQGRAAELESGKRKPTQEVRERLYDYFRERLGDSCPAPPETVN